MHKIFTCALLEGKNFITGLPSCDLDLVVIECYKGLGIKITPARTRYRNWWQGRRLCYYDSCEITYDLKEKSALYTITLTITLKAKLLQWKDQNSIVFKWHIGLQYFCQQLLCHKIIFASYSFFFPVELVVMGMLDFPKITFNYSFWSWHSWKMPYWLVFCKYHL